MNISKMIKIEPILVKNKNEVIKALTLLEKLGVSVYTEAQKEHFLNDITKTINNNYLIQEDDDSFRIQSHYLGEGISLESLEKQVDEVLTTYPKIRDTMVILKNQVDILKETILRTQEQIETLFNKQRVITLKEKK